MKKYYVCLFALVLLLAAPVFGQASCPSFTASKVMGAARFQTAGITVITAHRGYWEFVPENSTMSVQASVNQCIEAAEIDVRLLKGGTVPVLMHDQSLERTTTGDGWVSETTLATWITLTYLNRLAAPYLQLANQPGPVPANPNCGSVCSTWPAAVAPGQAVPVQTLQQFLSIMKTNQNLVLTIDAKDRGPAYSTSSPTFTSFQTLVASWAVVKQWESDNGLIIRDRIIWKMRINELPATPTSLDTALGLCGTASPCVDGDPNLTAAGGHFNLVPIWYSSDDQTATVNALCAYNQHIMGSTAPCEVASPLSFTGYLWNPEVSVSYPGTSLEPVLALYSQTSQNVTAFLPASDFAEGMHLVTAACCRYRYMMPFPLGSPPDLKANPPTDPVSNQEPIQYTGDIQFLNSRSYSWVSGDHVIDLLNYYIAINQRNTALISN